MAVSSVAVATGLIRIAASHLPAACLNCQPEPECRCASISDHRNDSHQALHLMIRPVGSDSGTKPARAAGPRPAGARGLLAPCQCPGTLQCQYHDSLPVRLTVTCNAVAAECLAPAGQPCVRAGAAVARRPARRRPRQLLQAGGSDLTCPAAGAVTPRAAAAGRRNLSSSLRFRCSGCDSATGTAAWAASDWDHWHDSWSS